MICVKGCNRKSKGVTSRNVYLSMSIEEGSKTNQHKLWSGKTHQTIPAPIPLFLSLSLSLFTSHSYREIPPPQIGNVSAGITTRSKSLSPWTTLAPLITTAPDRSSRRRRLSIFPISSVPLHRFLILLSLLTVTVSNSFHYSSFVHR
jgi:hypothetical protein